MSLFYFGSRAGLGRLQFLFGLAILLVFIVTVVVEVSSYLRLHSTERGVECARTLNTLLAQYATDNDGVYPVGEGTRAEGKSEGIALDLLLNSYTPNADVFAVGATPVYAGTAKDYADLAPENMSWDFTAGVNATTGIKSDAPDMLPVLYTTGETIDYAKTGQFVQSGNGPFGAKGMIVAYKNGVVFFLQKSQGIQMSRPFILTDLKTTGPYTQIRP